MKVLFLLALFFAQLLADNPYKSIIHYQLDNGMNVVLNPNKHASDVFFMMKVNTGYKLEDKNNLGVAHLLEHALFRDETIKDNQTYLDILISHGANTNAYTMAYTTVYYTNINAKKVNLSLDIYSKALINRNLSKIQLEKEKQTVAIEIGDIDYFTRKLNIDFEQIFSINLFPIQSASQKEFGLENRKHSMNKIRKNTKKLTTLELQNFYDTYYNASNMTLFLSGNFDIKSIKKQIKEKFSIQKTGIPNSKKKPPVVLNKEGRFYIPKDSLGENPRITVAIKSKNLKPYQSTAMGIYFLQLKQNLMKILRNKKGAAYTVSRINEKYGFDGELAGITLDTNKKLLISSYNYVKDTILAQTLNKNYSKDEFVQAKQLYYNHFYANMATDAQSLHDFAYSYYNFYTRYGIKSNWYEVLEKLNYQAFQNTLSQNFTKNRWYEELIVAPMFFQDDSIFLTLISMIVAFVIFNQVFKAKFTCVEVIEQKKLYNIWIKSLVYFLLTIAVFIIFIPLVKMLNYYLQYLPWYNHINLYAYYFMVIVKAFLFIFVFFIIMGLFKTKSTKTDSKEFLHGFRSKTISNNSEKNRGFITYLRGLNISTLFKK